MVIKTSAIACILPKHAAWGPFSGPPFGGLADHCLHIIYFCATVIFEMKVLTVMKHTGWRLQCKRSKHKKDIGKAARDAKWKTRCMYVMADKSNFASDAEHKIACEKFDKQCSELQVSKEKTCRKFKFRYTICCKIVRNFSCREIL